MDLRILDPDFSICKVKDISGIDFRAEFCFLSKTDEEISLVCMSGDVPANPVERDDGWKAFRIRGVLDFSLVGILSRISAILSDSGIGIFAVSTYNTDYIFTKAEDIARALAALKAAGYQIYGSSI